MTSGKQDTQKEILIFRSTFIFKIKQLRFPNGRFTQIRFLRLLLVPSWRPEKKDYNSLSLRNMKSTRVAKKKTTLVQ